MQVEIWFWVQAAPGHLGKEAADILSFIVALEASQRSGAASTI